jgi:two-component system sensor histidine kinase KdpD
VLPTITAAARDVLVADGVLVTLHAAPGDAPRTEQVGQIVGAPTYAVPIVLSGHAVGELRVWGGASLSGDEGVPLVQTVANHVALLVARAHAVEAALQTRSLREADRLKGALLSSVSHDLRTPLAAIKGAASNLLDTSVTWHVATQRMFAQTISSEADRLNRFVRNLLEISRLESTHAPRPHTPIEIGDVIAQTVQRLRPVLSQHTVEIRIAPNLPAVPMDAVQIELVLSNVLENAAKFAPHTPITVEAVWQDHALLVRVADRGPGVPPAVRDRIWDKFYWVAEPEQGPGGSGLGLAIAKGIVDAHGGRIWVEDRPGVAPSFSSRCPSPRRPFPSRCHLA